MAVLYRGADEPHRIVADLVPPRSEILDVCCGDCAIEPLLRVKGCRYIGLDLNPAFVSSARRRGLDVRAWDARADPVPPADFILLQSSLYQFVDRDRELLQNLLEMARRTLIVSEPVENWAASERRT